MGRNRIEERRGETPKSPYPAHSVFPPPSLFHFTLSQLVLRPLRDGQLSVDLTGRCDATFNNLVSSTCDFDPGFDTFSVSASVPGLGTGLECSVGRLQDAHRVDGVGRVRPRPVSPMQSWGYPRFGDVFGRRKENLFD